jgi:hypothetical protein
MRMNPDDLRSVAVSSAVAAASADAGLWKAKAEALAAELEEIDAAPQPRDIGQAIGGFLAGATVVAVIWWCTL